MFYKKAIRKRESEWVDLIMCSRESLSRVLSTSLTGVILTARHGSAPEATAEARNIHKESTSSRPRVAVKNQTSRNHRSFLIFHFFTTGTASYQSTCLVPSAAIPVALLQGGFEFESQTGPKLGSFRFF